MIARVLVAANLFALADALLGAREWQGMLDLLMRDAALLEPVLLASLVRAARFGWDGRHKPEPVSRVTLRPKGGMQLGIQMMS